ncbi:hypothetical protein [Actinoplanes sp. NPDC051851]|uniref:hypothetical protein n=1 Tax=Actinoplanes sp. NPDC051851 TaxID=3154753 RepID=UPI003442C538
MSSGGLTIDPEGLDASGQSLQGVAERFGAALATFQAEIASFGQPWGADDIGSLIGAAHDEVSAAAYECYQGVIDEMAAAGADLSGMAATYQALEDAIGQHMDTLRSGLDS